jgi:hypothetical protein
MKKPLGEVRIILLKGNRREHLAECDDSGSPQARTLCEKQYDPISRTGSRPYNRPDSKICPLCIRQYDMRKYGPQRNRMSEVKDLKIHFPQPRRSKPVCGQPFFVAENLTYDVGEVTCQRCYDWIEKQGEK